jgi:hypothetical protein
MSQMFRRKYLVSLLIVALIISALLVLKFAKHLSARVEEAHAFVILVSAQEWRPMWGENEVPFASEDFMIIGQPEDDHSITEAVAEVNDSRLIEHDCGTLSVTIASNGAITLNSDDVGTLRDPSKLKAKLTDVFNERIKQRAYLPGFERRTDLPDIKRIPRTVLLQPSGSVAAEDVFGILELLKELSAEPIGLQIAHLPT